ncbi:MAG: RluA family pseudouridine synthase [Clostridia bacterium]|nr:RluA family pseudouridine synthase [Clostridia bacterium]
MDTTKSVNILYEDAALVIAEKPAGMPSQPDPNGQPDLYSALSVSRPGLSLIHRLDTPTGGVMVFGKTSQTAAALSAAVQDHNVFIKEYLCVLSSAPDEPDGEMSDLLFHDSVRNKTYPVDRKRAGAKSARLAYRVVSTLPDRHTLVLVRLYTGRTHQIRAQFAARGLPLVGDGKYGSREKAPSLALWAVRLTFPHPLTRKPVQAVSLPDNTRSPWSAFDSEAWNNVL